MTSAWMTFDEAARVLGCGKEMLQRYAAAGDLVQRQREGISEICLNIDAAPCINDVTTSSRENEVALALARLAQQDAQRARKQLKLICCGFAILLAAAGAMSFWINSEAGHWRSAYFAVAKHDQDTGDRLQVALQQNAKLDQQLRDKKAVQQQALALLERVSLLWEN